MAALLACIAAILFLAASPDAAFAQKLIALVIGNSAYQHISALPNTANDARGIAASLRETGFELIGDGPQIDLDKAALENAIRAFGRRLGGDTGGSVLLFRPWSSGERGQLSCSRPSRRDRAGRCKV